MKNLQVGFGGLKGGHGYGIRYRYIDGYKVGYRRGWYRYHFRNLEAPYSPVVIICILSYIKAIR